MAQRIWPVIKLPGKTLMPCKNQTAPVNANKMPRMLKMIRIAYHLFGSFYLIDAPFLIEAGA
jgi:hypothetical protein